MNENLNRKDLELAIQKTRDSFDTDKPVIPFIEGDGIGIDIWPASQRVFDAAVEKAYSNERKIEWQEVLAGQKAFDNSSEWLPEKTIEMFDEFGIGIKGPLTTPVGGGIRSINVAIRQKLDLYACLRPLRWFEGVETPTKNPGNVDIALFRENTEDVYSGKELEMNSDDVVKLNKFLKEEFNWEIRSDSGIGIKPISKTASERLIRSALNYAVENNKKNVSAKYMDKYINNMGFKIVYFIAGPKIVEDMINKGLLDTLFCTMSMNIVGNNVFDTFIRGDILRRDISPFLKNIFLSGEGKGKKIKQVFYKFNFRK